MAGAALSGSCEFLASDWVNDISWDRMLEADRTISGFFRDELSIHAVMDESLMNNLMEAKIAI